MRKIAPQESCLTAEQVVDRFAQMTGYSLHATNAGNAAKSLGLDYAEGPQDAAFKRARRYYSERDLPLIFERLQELVQRRAKYL